MSPKKHTATSTTLPKKPTSSANAKSAPPHPHQHTQTVSHSQRQPTRSRMCPYLELADRRVYDRVRTTLRPRRARTNAQMRVCGAHAIWCPSACMACSGAIRGLVSGFLFCASIVCLASSFSWCRFSAIWRSFFGLFIHCLILLCVHGSFGDFRRDCFGVGLLRFEPDSTGCLGAFFSSALHSGYGGTLAPGSVFALTALVHAAFLPLGTIYTYSYFH